MYICKQPKTVCIMPTLEQILVENDCKSLETISKKSRIKARKIFNNMVEIASKKGYAMSIENNRVKQVRIEIKSLGEDLRLWCTPYIHNDRLFLDQGFFLFKGSDIFGSSVNKVKV